ncbi:MAG: phage tail sheath protein [Lachnospiraceae bacterium]|nr:phage tail sheath protein [Lachnospiraceae bacterium]
MGMPSITISFNEKAASAIKRGERGIIAMILKDAVPEKNPINITSVLDVPSTLSKKNQEQIELALMGYINPPKKVIAYVIGNEENPDGNKEDNYKKALTAFESIKFDYLVVPTVQTDGKTQDIVDYVKEQRKADKLIKAVLPSTKGDSEGIINFTTAELKENDKTYTTEEYCSRIAGIIAGTPLNMSCTYASMTELTDCTRLARADEDKAIESGELIAWFDGEKVKLGRGVNSLTTTSGDKGKQFKKIKIVDVMDMISSDIKTTIQDNYIGKYANTYDNKCLLISAIGNYLDSLVKEEVLSESSISIDIEANRSFLKEKGIDTDSMSEYEIKTANTGSSVFLMAKISIVDAIEDIVLPIAI